MNTDELIKVLSCGDASYDEQEQAAETIEELYRRNRELLIALDAVDSEIALEGHLQELVSDALTRYRQPST